MTTSSHPAPDLTAPQCAAAAAEAIRALNHALAVSPSVVRPDEAYAVVGDLATLASRLPQALSALGLVLQRQQEAGRLRSDRDALPEDMATIISALIDAAYTAERLDRAVRPAHAALSHLAYRG
ncbi:hypothetical protein E0L36_13900 [Streptomyces sp. AJS327]|uniref:hypothetical protein n=1 Tax=Streptomyces sp. AJS327 TaxID=2545265 RepID=UPI0015DFC9FE|nr:hypothetical protein [Streptomyces sp. AJS327]MBA0051948.1 hypothetical protein [Streptomyces sp. AJS327]